MRHVKKLLLLSCFTLLLGSSHAHAGTELPGELEGCLPSSKELLSLLPTYDKILADAKDAAKLSALTTFIIAVIYYFHHYPEHRASHAPIENLLRGYCNNLKHDIFNWDNIRYFSDIFPGQRWKIRSFKLEHGIKYKLKIVTPGKESTRGFGLLHFVEKNLGKIVRAATVSVVAYHLLYKDLKGMSQELINMLLNTREIINKFLNPAITS